MAHFLAGYEGPCKNICGYTYELRITVSGPVKNTDGNSDNEMVSKTKADDFKDLRLEHKIIFCESQPTCENMIVFIGDKIMNFVEEPLLLHSVRPDEGPGSYCRNVFLR